MNKIQSRMLIVVLFILLKGNMVWGIDFRALAENQFNYAVSLQQQGNLYGAIKEYINVYKYPEAIDWCCKAFRKIQEIISGQIVDKHGPEVDEFVLPFITYYQQIIQENPGTEEAALAQFAICIIYSNDWYQHVKRFDFRQVTQEFQKIIDNYPQSSLIPHALMEIGDSYGRLGYTIDDYPKSIAIYQQIIQDYPNTIYASTAQYNIGITYIGLADYYGYFYEDPKYYPKAIEELTKIS